MGYADDTTIYAVIPRLLSCHQVVESLIQDLVAINSWCIKWNMEFNPKKTKPMTLSQCRTSVPGYGDFTLRGANLEELKSLRIYGVSLDSKLMFETHFREVVSKTARSLGVVC